MKIGEFAKLVAQSEGLKKQVNIAQIKEILKVIEKIFKSAGLSFYKSIRDFDKG